MVSICSLALVNWPWLCFHWRALSCIKNDPCMNVQGLDFLTGLIERDPLLRLTAEEALEHPWFKLHLQQQPAERSPRQNNIVPRAAAERASPVTQPQPVLAAAAAAPAPCCSVLRVGRSYPLASVQKQQTLTPAFAAASA